MIIPNPAWPTVLKVYHFNQPQKQIIGCVPGCKLIKSASTHSLNWIRAEFFRHVGMISDYPLWLGWTGIYLEAQLRCQAWTYYLTTWALTKGKKGLGPSQLLRHMGCIVAWLFVLKAKLRKASAWPGWPIYRSNLPIGRGGNWLVLVGFRSGITTLSSMYGLSQIQYIYWQSLKCQPK